MNKRPERKQSQKCKKNSNRNTERKMKCKNTQNENTRQK